MLSLTQKAIEEFDNQHDFERMSADILNTLGYRDVTPIAPRGGGDGGRDITFTTESKGKGLACVSLREDTGAKFNEDFSQRKAGEYEKYYFFTNRYLTSSQKVKLAKFCLDKLNAELIIQDREALRSLLDSAFQEIRKKYFHIDDDSSALIRKKVAKILKYRATLAPTNFQDRAGLAEWMLTRPMHREIYYYIIDIDDDQLRQIPKIGEMLQAFKEYYYQFCLELGVLTEHCKELIDRQSLSSYQRIYGWTIYFKFLLVRSFGNSKEEAQKQIALNYDITYEDCERVFNLLSSTPEAVEIVKRVNAQWKEVSILVNALSKEVDE